MNTQIAFPWSTHFTQGTCMWKSVYCNIMIPFTFCLSLDPPALFNSNLNLPIGKKEVSEAREKYILCVPKSFACTYIIILLLLIHYIACNTKTTPYQS